MPQHTDISIPSSYHWQRMDLPPTWVGQDCSTVGPHRYAEHVGLHQHRHRLFRSSTQQVPEIKHAHQPLLAVNDVDVVMEADTWDAAEVSQSPRPR